MADIIAKDVGGKTINVGDIIIFGYNNGSTLQLAKVFKITPKKVWFNGIMADGELSWWNGHRSHNRVAKYEVFNG